MPDEVYSVVDGKITIDSALITKTTINNEISLSYNGSVFCVVTKDDLVGSGSQASPYVVKSLKGLLWIANYSFSKIDLRYKYIELGSDIVLNDEKIDNNGNISGGDGIVYLWGGISTGSYATFNGNYHTIYGMYYHNEEGEYGGFFGAYVYLNEVANLNFKNVYVCGQKWCSTLGSLNFTTVKNCNVYSGKVMTIDTYVGGLVYDTKYIFNSNNYANVESGAAYAGGICAKVPLITENCNNYGNVYGRQYVGGICGGWRENKDVYIKGCNNYGSVSSYIGTNGGIVALFHYYNDTELSIVDCSNYGKIISPSGSTIGGIAGLVEGAINITNCKNFGYIDVIQGAAQIVGAIQNTHITSQIIANITDCYSVSSGCPIVCQVQNQKTDLPAIVNIKNHKFDMKIFNKKYRSNIFVYYGLSKANINIENVEGNIYVENSELYFLYNLSASGVNLKIKNVVLNARCVNIKNSRFEYGTLGTLKTTKYTIEGLIFNNIVDGVAKRVYYGNDFSGMFCDFKTGRFGVRALNGKGFFQGGVTEEVLKNKGYTKKEV